MWLYWDMGSFRHLPSHPASCPTRVVNGLAVPRPSYLDGSLLDPRFDSDSCGVGFVAQLSAEPSHGILQQALTALARLAHRGAVAADGKSSDGVGLTTAVPRAFLLKETGVALAAEEPLGVGVLYLPAGEKNKNYAKQAEESLASCLNSRQLRVLAWRD